MDHLRLERFRWDAENCCGCKSCIWVDPIYVQGKDYSIRCPSLQRFKFDSYSALGRLKLALAILNGSMKITEKALDIIYQCNLCGACDTGCKRNLDLDPLMVLEALRIRAVAQGAGPPPALAQLIRRVRDTGNRFGLTRAKSAAWIPEGIKPSNRAKIAYFVGCNASYKNNSIAQATVKILEHLGIEYALMEEESCCGHPLFVSGAASEALALAKTNIEMLSDAGASIVLTSCAECYKTWKVDYPKLLDKPTSDMPYKAVHLVELLAGLLAKGGLRFRGPIEMKVAYHDPCCLGRLSEDWTPWHGSRGPNGLTQPPKPYRRGTNGIYQQPRQLISAIEGLELIDLPRTRENALCCGAGGGVLDVYPEFAAFTAQDRLQEVIDSGAQAVVSACPYCLDSFQVAIQSTGHLLKAYDISHLVSLALLGHEVAQ